MAKHLLTILACGFFVLAVGNVPVAAFVVIGGTLVVIVEDRWQQRRARAGYIYLLSGPIGDDGFGTLVKIGRTNNLERRLRQHRTTLPGCDYLHTFPAGNARDAERRLHDRYVSKRGFGEWFALTSRDIADLKKIRRM